MRMPSSTGDLCLHGAGYDLDRSQVNLTRTATWSISATTSGSTCDCTVTQGQDAAVVTVESTATVGEQTIVTPVLLRSTPEGRTRFLPARFLLNLIRRTFPTDTFALYVARAALRYIGLCLSKRLSVDCCCFPCWRRFHFLPAGRARECSKRNTCLRPKPCFAIVWLRSITKPELSKTLTGYRCWNANVALYG